ncbi:uncharacterized protein BXZ73DRAFT_108234 [Epithele typhae]|uniref:uncharacterized protein n=1 Tax=Epithele typhae TaxID=378194 RepID=UPI0020071E06|nr:uncharacterized protein BXZ73DRAFT_108234 [Epithele typhae]KAH9911122.1 hypothetical protein BXZ73DRAFT_108234 [Epithele typhae]
MQGCFLSNRACEEPANDPFARARSALDAARQGLALAPIPNLSSAVDALNGVVQNVERVSLSPLKKTRWMKEWLGSLAVEIRELAELIKTAPTDVQAILDDLNRSERLVEETESFLRGLEKLGEGAEELQKGNLLRQLVFSSRDVKMLKKLKTGVASLGAYFKTQAENVPQLKLDPPKLETAPEPEVTPAPEPEAPVPVVEEEPAPSPVEQLVAEGVAESVPEPVAPPVEEDPAPVPQPKREPAKRYDDVLERLPRALVGYESHLKEPQKRLLPGTRQDAVAELSRWATGQEVDVSTQTICVLTGAPGLGKSTIAADFAQRLGHRLGASFFFARGIADTSSTRLFFRTIAYQLAYSQGDLHDVFAKAVRDHIHDIDDLLPQDTGKILFRDPLLLAEPRDDDPVFLVIDGLDECFDTYKTGPSKMIESLVSSVRQAPFPLKIFFTSSPGDVVDTTVIANVKLVDTVHIVDLNQQPLEWADKNFLYADVAARFLVEDTTDINSHPRGAYPRDVIHAEPQTCEDVQAVLGGLALLRDALSPNTSKPSSGDDQEASPVLHRLSAVVDCNPNDPDAPARALHASFARFLVDVHPKYDKGPYLVRTRREHGRLAAACLRALIALARAAGWSAARAVRVRALGGAPRAVGPDERGVRARGELRAGGAAEVGEAVAEMKRLDVVDGALEKASAWQEIGKIRGLLDAVRKWVGEHRDAVKVRP